MTEVSDANLIAHSLERPAEFGAIFDRHAATLLRFLTRRVGPDAAAPLLGELFRVAFEYRSGFDLGRESARPWLYGIASNLLMHDRRSHARKTRTTRALEEEIPAPQHSNPGEDVILDQVDARLLLPIVAVALRTLPEIERETLLLFAWEDQTYDEISEALDVPIGTVRSRIHRARRRLRELISAGGKDSIEPPDSPVAREGHK